MVFNQKYVIYAVSFMDLFAVGLTVPLLLPHLRSIGASHFVAGVFGSTYSALQVLAGPVIGSWSDVKGRKIILINTLVLSSITYFLLGLTSSLNILFLLRVILGCIKHTQTLCKAIIADLFPRAQHSEMYGQSSALGSLGFVVGPVIGGHLSEYPHGFFYVCCLTAVLFLINIGLAYSIPEKSRAAVNKEMRNDTYHSLKNIHVELFQAVTDLVKVDWKIYWDAFILRFCYALAVSIYFSHQSLYIQEKYDLSQKYIGYTISFLSVISSISGFVLGAVTKKYYKNDINCTERLFHAYIMLTTSLIGLYLSPDLVVFLIMLVPFAISSSILRIVSMERMITTSPNNERGSLSGTSNSIMSIARFISPISSGLISDIFGESSVMLYAFLPSFLGTILCMRLRFAENIPKITK